MDSSIVENFQSMVGRSIDSSELVKYIDENINWPSLLHWNCHQLVWIRDREWCKGFEEHRQVSENEAGKDYNNFYTSDFHKFYFTKYIAQILDDSQRLQELDNETFYWLKSKLEEMVSKREINYGTHMLSLS